MKSGGFSLGTDAKAWVSDLEEYALSTLLAGGEFRDGKLLRARVRQFDDIDKHLIS